MAGEPKCFVIYKDKAGEWRWTLYAANAKKIADSGEGYVKKSDCIHGARLVAETATNAGIYNGETKAWET